MRDVPTSAPTGTPSTPAAPRAARPPRTSSPAPGREGRGTRLPDLGPRGEGWVAIQGLLFVVAALAGSLGPSWGAPWLLAGRVAGVALVGAGVIVGALGLAGLRENLTAVPRPVAGGHLVDGGVYGIVRHPIYAGIIVAAAGWGLATASLAALGAALVLGLFFDLKSRREEAWLVAAYPGYAAYRRRVRKLVPLVY
ncbi:MAG: isoprenylcysteine carboxylmethyltransferase family protein [Chloroflexi bacterium]|nr:isoprenylcysteine carboxylmethyltransferase family protein [Chloroflexota bacterium]